MAQLAAILDPLGPELTPDDRAFFKSADPWGFILFRRHCVSRAQVRRLTDDLRSLTGRADVPILIDEEGGRVQRLKPPEWPVRPPMQVFGDLFSRDTARGLEAAKLNAQLIAADLIEIGVNVDCIPSLDLPAPGSHAIVGDRAFGTDPALIATLGRAVCDAVLQMGVLPVIKHMPGHGRATLDTHHALPRVTTPRAELSRTDFAPFRTLRDQPLGMSAHVVFESVDTRHPATLSATVIADVIRGEIGFDGLLMTDDLSMKALDGSPGQRASGAIAAGCDIALFCNGTLAEKEEVAKAVPSLSGMAFSRADAALRLLKRQRAVISVADASQRLKELLA